MRKRRGSASVDVTGTTKSLEWETANSDYDAAACIPTRYTPNLLCEQPPTEQSTVFKYQTRMTKWQYRTN